jgi:SAM-dependent methyltransferase
LLERFPEADIVGFDLSEKACEAYRRNTGRPAHALDLTAGTDTGLRVDVAMVFGGLHHCVADLPGTFQTIAGMLRPGGLLMMYEPNVNFMLEGFRRIWYRFDRYFDAPTETAISHDRIAHLAAKHFRPRFCRYMGGPAYFLIFNSLVFRIPPGWKKFIAPPLFSLEAIYNRLPGRLCYPYFVACWERNAAPLNPVAPP